MFSPQVATQSIRTVTGALGILALMSAPAWAQEPAGLAAASSAGTISPSAAPEAREWFGSQPWSEWTTVTGDWNTVRSWLNRHGFVVAAAETADVSSVTSSAGDRVAVARGLLDASVAADASVLRVPGGSALVQLQWLPGENGSEVLGDLQGFSNIDAESVPVVGEVWYEQKFGDRVRAKVGRVDANSEFAYVDAAGDFLSASMGFSPSIVALPTYPTPSSSVSVFVQPLSGIDVAGGVFNGSPEDGRWIGWDSRFAIAQVSAAWAFRGASLPGRVTSGGWRFQNLSDASDRTEGVYVTAEQTLWARAERNASAFVQVGSSDARSPVRHHTGGGVAVRGLSSRRPLDVTGAGATWVRLAAEDSAAPSELVTELFHRVVLTPSISVIPDVQLVSNATGDAARNRTAAFTCRVRFDF